MLSCNHHVICWFILQGRSGAPGGIGPGGRVGPPGSIGESGPPGFTGERGEQGRSGVTGSTGPRGYPGATGRPGTPGGTGSTGSPAKTGEGLLCWCHQDLIDVFIGACLTALHIVAAIPCNVGGGGDATKG